IAVTGQGPASSTVTRSTRPSSRNRWVIPSFLARMAGMSVESESDLNVPARGKMGEPLERVDGLGRGLMDIDQALVRPDLEVLLGVLVLEGGLHHGIHVLLGRQRHRAGDSGASPRRGLDDLLGRGLDGRRVVRLETDADLVLGYGHVLSGTWSEISAGYLRAMRAAPGLRGPPSNRSYLSTSCAAAGGLDLPPRFGLSASGRMIGVGRWGCPALLHYSMISVTTPEPT